MKTLLTIFILTLSTLSFGQNEKDTVKVLAKFIKFNKFNSQVGRYSSNFKVISNLGNNVKDTILVGHTLSNYYYYMNLGDTVLLKIIKNKKDSNSNEYHFPYYYMRNGIEKVRFDRIGFDYLGLKKNGSLKKGKRELHFKRFEKTKNWFLIAPCGGNLHAVTKRTSGWPHLQSIEDVNILDTFPVFNLTNLKDGEYHIYLLYCIGIDLKITITSEDISIINKRAVNKIDSLLLFNKLSEFDYPNKTYWGGLNFYYHNSKLIYFRATQNGEMWSMKSKFYLNNGKISKIIYSENEHKTPNNKYKNLSFELNRQGKNIKNNTLKKTDSLKINNLIQNGKDILKFLKDEKLDVHYRALSDMMMNKKEIDSLIMLTNKLISKKKLTKYSLKNMHLCGGAVKGYFNKDKELQKIESLYQYDNGNIKRTIYFYKNNICYTFYKEYLPELEKDVLYYCYNSISKYERQLKINGNIINKLPFEETKKDRDFYININKCIYKMEHDLLKEYKTNVK